MPEIEKALFDECLYSCRQYNRLKQEKGEFDLATQAWYGRFCGLFDVICTVDGLVPKYDEFVRNKRKEEQENGED